MRKVLLLLLCIFLGTSLFAQAPLKRPTKAKPQKAQVARPQSQPAKPKQTRGTINGHEWVDLGLPSGVKWATCNVGANSPEDYGDYFAWGETQPKGTYDWSTYKWCNGTDDSQNKYCTSSSYGIVDNKKTLEASDDAARVQWGSGWRMPTLAEFEELKSKCTWTMTTQNGVNGYKVTGPNGNSIFLPAAGCRYEGDLYYAGSHGNYWSSSLYESNPRSAYCLRFSSDVYSWYDYSRYDGQSVRAVVR